MLDTIYHMTIKYLNILGVKTLKLCHYVCNVVMDVITRQHY